MDFEDKRIRIINFDLDTNKLKAIYPNTSVAYKKIRTTMNAEGFDKWQYSGYISREEISRFDLNDTVKRITKANPWLQACTKRIGVTVAEDDTDLLFFVKKVKTNS